MAAAEALVRAADNARERRRCQLERRAIVILERHAAAELERRRRRSRQDRLATGGAVRIEGRAGRSATTSTPRASTRSTPDATRCRQSRGIDEIRWAIAAGGLRATTDAREAVRDAGVVVLIVPVDIDAAHAAGLRALDAAVDAVAPHLERGALVIVGDDGAGRHDAESRRRTDRGALRDGGRRRLQARLQPGARVVGHACCSICGHIRRSSAASTQRAPRAAVAFYRAMLDAEIMPCAMPRRRSSRSSPRRRTAT